MAEDHRPDTDTLLLTGHTHSATW